METIVWGFPNAYGDLLDAYFKEPALASQPSAQFLLPMIGTLTSGIMYCSAPLLKYLVYRYPHQRRAVMWAGAAISWASLLGASYANQVAVLLLCEGVLYAIGGAMLYSSCTYYASE